SYKIVMLAARPFPYPRGTPIRIYRMADALPRRGHVVHVIAYHLHLAEPPAQPPAFQLHRIPVVATYQKCSPGPSLQKLLVLDPLLAIKTARLMREHAFDVIHAHHFEGMLAGLLGRAAR